jgi:putative ABC transport system permease protein
MFLRIAARSSLIAGRRGRALTALIAVATAAAVVSAILNLSRDVQEKVRGELRKYGANMVLMAPEGKDLPANSLGLIESALKDRGAVVPFAYVVARTANDAPIVVAGTDFERARKINAWWQASAWPEGRNSALLGARAARLLSPGSRPFQLTFNDRSIRLTPAGVLRTGGAEDNRIYVALSDLFEWTGVHASVMEISAYLSREELVSFQRKLESMFPSAHVREVRQITEAEAAVFSKTRAALLISVLLIVVTAVLSVLANLTSSVLDRRKDFAVIKALGASDWAAEGIFLVEAVLVGTAGAVLGYVAGAAIAVWIGHSSLHQTVLPRLDVLPVIVAGSIALTVLAGLFPIRMLRQIQPAAILKGE